MDSKRPLNVFVSASAADREARDALVDHLHPLVRAKTIALWHADAPAPGDDVPLAADDALARADVALVLASRNYLASGDAADTELPRIREAHAQRSLHVVPVLLSPCALDVDPFLGTLQALPSGGVPISKHTDPDDARNEIAKALVQMAAELNQARPSLGPPEVSRRHLPTGGALLLGREAELAQLDEAWASHGRIRVQSIVAMGGAGKSTLVIHWLNRLAAEDYRGARRVFGYSFYRQGTSDAAADTDPFFAAAFRFFGLSESAMPPLAERPDRLIALCRRERTLLLLDGLEPIQDHAGRIKDQALRIVLRELCAQSPGLVVLTSRVAIEDLAADEGSTARVLRLDKLPVPSGIALLRKLGVTGHDEELREAVDDFKGHPLALTLLGTLLARGYRGDIRHYEQLPCILDEKNPTGGQASRAMKAYDHWLGGRERAILRLVGLFDRPAPGGALAALRAKPVVEGLNEELVGLGDVAWRETIADLRTAGLVEKADEADPDAVDAHPLVREYFGGAFKQANEAAWKKGNRRLYAWYASVPKKERPDTAKEMEPLYAAVMHGCRAGMWQEAMDEVFWKRIDRGEEGYSTSKLSAFGANLSMMAGFFEEPWTQPVTALREASRGFVLNEAGFAFRALGRLPEAVAPMRAGLQLYIDSKNWEYAARVASNLSELHLTLGQLPEAIETARQSVEQADRSGDAFQRLSDRTTLADALHQAGQPDEAARLFIEAERMQKEMQPEFPLLYSLGGYRYCDLLLSRGEAETVRRRAELTLKYWDIFTNGGPIEFALEHLSIARAHLALHPNAPETRTHFDEAVARLREAGQQDYLTHGLIHRAAFHRHLHELPAASRDLDEALRLATRGQMRRYEADARLERARLFLAQKNPDSRAELDSARWMIDEMGYGRRMAEVDMVASELGPTR